MDRQSFHSLIGRILQRFDRRPPRPVLVYGRRVAPAAGFSPAELAEAGLDETAARNLGLPVDASRMSALGSNVSPLRDFLRR